MLGKWCLGSITDECFSYVRKPPMYLKSGDEVSIDIEGIGRLTNGVV